MAEWPTVGEVKLVLGIDSDARDGVISSAVGAAIEQVLVDVGYYDISVTQESEPTGPFTATGVLFTADTDDLQPVFEVVPSHSLNQAALILSVMAVKAPDAPYGVAAVFDLGGLQVASQHPTYTRMLTGHRLRFGIG